MTQLLNAIARGKGSTDDLLPLVYGELRALARARLRLEKGPITLQPTALVHEAYLRLLGSEGLEWNSRGHFFGAAAQAMRRILVERARKYQRERHGGGMVRKDLSENDAWQEFPYEDLLALEDALGELEKRDPRMAKVVMLRYFAGLSVEETAAAMELSPRTVKREWRVARLHLHRWMTL